MMLQVKAMELLRVCRCEDVKQNAGSLKYMSSMVAETSLHRPKTKISDQPSLVHCIQRVEGEIT